MRVEKKALGYYTDLYRLRGAEDRKQRYINYNNILFKCINDLQNSKQIIIINEVGNGGVVYGSTEYANLALRRLKSSLKDKYVAVVATEVAENYKKIAFSINDKWKIDL